MLAPSALSGFICLCIGILAITPGNIRAQQEPNNPPAAFLFKIYPTSIFKKELRAGLERQIGPLKSIQVDGSYLAGAKEPEKCYSYCIPGLSFVRYVAHGGGLRLSLINYQGNVEQALSGRFYQYTLYYRYLERDNSYKSSFSAMRHQNHLGVQLVTGHQKVEGNFSGSIFGGLGFYYYWGKGRQNEFTNPYRKSGSSGILPQILLGFSIGAGRN